MDLPKINMFQRLSSRIFVCGASFSACFKACESHTVEFGCNWRRGDPGWTWPLDSNANGSMVLGNPGPILAFGSDIFPRVSCSPRVRDPIFRRNYNWPRPCLRQISTRRVSAEYINYNYPKFNLITILDLFPIWFCIFLVRYRRPFILRISESQRVDFYTKHELPFRLALFWMSSNLCNIFASFIAFGVLHMRGVLDRAGWRSACHHFHLPFSTYIQ